MKAKITLVLSLVALVVYLSSEPTKLFGQANGGNPCDGTCYIISDQVWVDDGDGIQEMDDPINPEAPLPGVTVKLYNATQDGSPIGNAISTKTTNSLGKYSFDVQDGVYVLQFSYSGNVGGGYHLTLANQTFDNRDSDANAQTGYTSSIVVELNVPVGAIWDAGFISDGCGPLTLGNKIWEEKNDDSSFLAGTDTGIGGATVQLWKMTARFKSP